MKKPDLLLPIAIWEFITALGVLIGISAIFTFAFPAVISGLWGAALTGSLFGLSVGVLILTIMIVIALGGGLGLLLGKEWGRTLSIVHAVMTALWIPVGTAIGILIILYLTKEDVRHYFLSGGSSQGT